MDILCNKYEKIVQDRETQEEGDEKDDAFPPKDL